MQKYKPLNKCVIVKSIDKSGTSEYIELTQQQLAEHLCIGVRQRIPLNECVECEVVESDCEIKKGKSIHCVSSSMNWIPQDKENYWVENENILLVDGVPYLDYVLCREISLEQKMKESGLVLPSSYKQEGNDKKAFVYHGGNSGLNGGDVVFFNWQKAKYCSIDGAKCFVIDKKYIMGAINEKQG